ncbi:MAG TPA: amidohydrolase family protein [Opitutales bacterium]|nr:amidohydrolase family protein [Opitutales bacterium]
MIIDCHTHCYPEELASAPRPWAEARRELHWADLVAPQGRKGIQDWADPGRFLEEMDRNGVDRAVLLGWYWENEATCRWHNEVIGEWLRFAPERFIGFAAILPNENVIEQLELALSLGLRGVGELHPGVQNFDSKSKHWQALARWCTAHNWPVNCHATAEKSSDHPSAVPTPLRDYLKMAEDAPALKLILAHWGGGLPLQGAASLPPNLYFDTAASPLLYPMEVFREAVDKIGTSRILYGSDYPLRIFPRRYRNAEMSAYLKAIQTETGLREAELTSILGGNFERLMVTW